jgi:spore coat protein CotH
VVRSSSTETALNEAVALDLLEQTGLASEHAVTTRFSVNGGEETLRLVVQNLDGTWDEENFDTDGILYKAEAGGDYSYRGEAPDAYTDVFDQETDADEEDLAPLIEFLEFINDSDDQTFSAELGDHLDVEAFATYLAFEDLIANFDDIDGPGNNS